MSGPWDPSPGARRDPDEPDPDWPSRDLEAGRDRPQRDPGDGGWDDWSRADTPTPPSTEPISRWDDWPPAPPDEELEPEPEPLTSDPWAESWEPEPAPRPAPEPAWRPEPERPEPFVAAPAPVFEPLSEPIIEPPSLTAYEPTAEVAAEPAAAPMPEPDVEPASEAFPEADDFRTPAYEPYHENGDDDIGWAMPVDDEEPEPPPAPGIPGLDAASLAIAPHVSPQVPPQTEPEPRPASHPEPEWSAEAEPVAAAEPAPEPEAPAPPPARPAGPRPSLFRAAITERRPFWRSRSQPTSPAPVAEPEPGRPDEPEPADEPSPQPALEAIPAPPPEPVAEVVPESRLAPHVAGPEPGIASAVTEVEPESELGVPPVVADEEPEREIPPFVGEPVPKAPVASVIAELEPEAEEAPVVSVMAEVEPAPQEAPDVSVMAEPEPQVVAAVAEPAADRARAATWEPDDAAAAAADAEAMAPFVEPPRIAYEPDDGPEIIDEDGDGLRPKAGRIETSVGRWLGTEPREEASTAEHAVPWLIGIILLLAGMVIVLMALIFSGEESLGGVAPDPSTQASPRTVAITTPTPRPTPRPAASAAIAAASAAPSATPAPAPQFGALEMVYLGRSEALAPIYLLRRDFTVADDPTVLAFDPALDVRNFAWARDGSHGAALLVDVMVSIEPGAEKRRLAETIRTLTFGDDASTAYAVRVTESGANDTATVIAIDFVSGAATDLASVTYARPAIQPQEGLREAQFADDGGAVRLFWLEGSTLLLWVLGASGWQVDPATGATTEVGAESLPNLWSPQGDHRVVVAESGSTSAIVLYNADGEEVARTVAEGLVSHLRWAPDGSQVVFTLGRSGAAGGVLQDLYMWNLEPDVAPTPTTNTGAAFGAEWLGSAQLWRQP